MQGSFFNPDQPVRAPADDYQPAGPPRRMCYVCGLKYLPEPGKDSPCGHTKKDGTIQP